MSSVVRDVDIRRALIQHVRILHADEEDTRYLEEVGLCQGTARVDVAVVNGSLHGYEIKSERDTLYRLPSQRLIYDRAFDYVTLVASPQHVEKILQTDVIPEWWGVLSAEQKGGSITLETSRREKKNPSVEGFAIAQFLWRDEALRTLETLGHASGLRNKSKLRIWERLSEVMTVEELGGAVREVLKSREHWKVDALQA